MTATMTSAPVAVIDLLNSLLEAELNSVFRFIGEGSPYLSRATAEVRRPLQEMVAGVHRRAAKLAALIESLGQTPRPTASIRSDEQYLAFLSLKFLLPKLLQEKRLAHARYENALATLRRLPQVPPEVPAIIEADMADCARDLAALERAASHVAGNVGAEKDPSQPAAGTKKNSDAGPSAG